jgi:hypothetical protein
VRHRWQPIDGPSPRVWFCTNPGCTLHKQSRRGTIWYIDYWWKDAEGQDHYDYKTGKTTPCPQPEAK